MRILMMSWEYPPVIVGGLSRHVHALATELADQGHDVVVLCRQDFGTDATTHPNTDSVTDNVRVVRVAEDPPHLTFPRDLVAWTLAMGHAMIRAAHRLLRDWRPDVVHAHDWLVTHPAVALADLLGVPLVVTMHATEARRHGGWLSEPLRQQVHSVEWWLVNRADALITCSASMRADVAQLFDVEPDGITVIHNGITTRDWAADAEGVASARRRYAPRDEPLLLFFGRLEWEKGIQDLIAALPKIRAAHAGTRLVVAGRGTYEQKLLAAARKYRVRRAIDFVGHLSDRDLRATLAAADAVVLPSRHEPFGIVALEAAAAGVPLVASTAGGLSEVVIDGRTGVSFPPDDVPAMADAVGSVLADRDAAQIRARAAFDRLAIDFHWPRIATATAAVYANTRLAVHDVLGRPKIATGNAFGV